ncbi:MULTISPECIES: hypothetical protein [unclassified Streptomyces]|uniref:hypothetical protein n=1 Tax=unclassified Streptomyces TaxID=2593676 RepID=UPI0028C46D8D|nr:MULTISPECIES: hypothetical protein [unclassified Streptomyces]WNO71250.1 hypothetical protein RPQ07_06265 [Streptomyces sp. AM8-1-1]
MTLDEAVSAVSVWGEAKVLRRSTRRSVKVLAVCEGVSYQALLEDGERVTAIELWWPGEGKETNTRVLLDGDDVFRTPAEDILERARAAGLRVDDSQPDSPVVPGVSLGFTRQTSQEVPRDSHGLPLYFTSVLVGNEDYYNYRYESGS